MKDVLTNLYVFVSVAIILCQSPLYGQDVQWGKRNGLLSTEQISFVLQNIDKVPCCDSNCHVHSMLSFKQTDTAYSLMPERLSGKFIIQRIVVKKDNYILNKKNLHRKKLYLIDIQSDTTSLSHLCIISANLRLNGRRLRTGDTINTVLLTCFPHDNFRYLNGTCTLPSLHQSCWIIIDSIFIDNLPFRYRNFLIFNTFAN